MSKLFKFKTCIALPEAARRISDLIGESVSADELIQLARDGHIRLSVSANHWVAYHVHPCEGFYISARTSQWRPEIMLNGVYRLLSVDFELRAEKLAPNESSGNYPCEGIMVVDKDEKIYECYLLPEDFTAVQIRKEDLDSFSNVMEEDIAQRTKQALLLAYEESPIIPMELFRRPSLDLVIAPEDLTSFVEKVNGNIVGNENFSPEKPLHNLERKSVAQIVAVLASMAKLNIQEPYAADEVLRAAAASAGLELPSSPETVVKFFKSAQEVQRNNKP